MRRLFEWIIALSIGSSVPAAMAQDIGSTTPRTSAEFARNRSTTVTERIIPGYDRPGVDAGVFNLRPQLLLSAFYSDNLYASDNDKVSDVALVAAPTVNAVADLQHTKIGIGGSVQFARFLSRDAENNTPFRTRATIDHDFGSSINLRGELGYERRVEQRSDPGAIRSSVEPILFDIAIIGSELEWQGSNLRLVGSTSYSGIDFQNGRLADGNVLSQRYRDRHLFRAGGLADYALSADFALRGQINYAKSDYKRPNAAFPLDRSTSRVEVLAGASFEFTDLLRGEFGVGYINQKFTNADQRGFSGFGGRGQIEYLVSPLTTFTLRASRTIEEAGLARSPTFIRTIASLSVDHELYRNVIVSGYGGYSTNRFREPSRKDHRPVFGVSSTYRMNRNVSVVARFDHLSVSSTNNSLGDFSLNTASIGFDIGF